MVEQCLPGFGPEFMRIDVDRQTDGSLCVSVLAAQDRRYLSSADRATYENLEVSEALDVVAAVLDALWFEPPPKR